MKIQFTKMHGLGNDFIIIDNRAMEEIDFSSMAVNLCRRRFSIGADGILVIAPSSIAGLKMEIFNPDGSQADMCGNGIRCFARHVFEEGILPSPRQAVETLAGIIRPEIIEDPGSPGGLLVRVDMGPPGLDSGQIPVNLPGISPVIDQVMDAAGEQFTFSAVSMGNPHCLIFVEEPTDRLVREIGPRVEAHPLFPRKTNVEFIRVEGRDRLNVRVWERGAGETMACGTGACASVVAGRLKGLLDSRVTVHLPGGSLQVEWDGQGSVMMTGPAVEVFRGWVSLPA